ncbi:hypothetical protein ADJ73_12245 [Arsenicicoccus sp. oral taxon 190]|nr:hypothetical protein ADJ73_12245 [Arsenicicoccus sp. oral taxon 190]
MTQIIGEFTVASVQPVDWAPEVTTALPTGHAHMVKEFTGAIEGRSITQFVFAFDAETTTGSYVAMESFEGRIGKRTGTVNFWHAATTIDGADRQDPQGTIVPRSGTGDLADLTGSVDIRIDADGTHHLVITPSPQR